MNAEFNQKGSVHINGLKSILNYPLMCPQLLWVGSLCGATACFAVCLSCSPTRGCWSGTFTNPLKRSQMKCCLFLSGLTSFPRAQSISLHEFKYQNLTGSCIITVNQYNSFSTGQFSSVTVVSAFLSCSEGIEEDRSPLSDIRRLWLFSLRNMWWLLVRPFRLLCGCSCKNELPHLLLMIFCGSTSPVCSKPLQISIDFCSVWACINLKGGQPGETLMKPKVNKYWGRVTFPLRRQ